MLWQSLTDAGAKLRTYVVKGRLHSTGKVLHTGSGGKGNQSNDQSILNHILTFLAIDEVLDLKIELE
jgi:aspartate 1-decarboxylase